MSHQAQTFTPQADTVPQGGTVAQNDIADFLNKIIPILDKVLGADNQVTKFLKSIADFFDSLKSPAARQALYAEAQLIGVRSECVDAFLEALRADAQQAVLLVLSGLPNHFNTLIQCQFAPPAPVRSYASPQADIPVEKLITCAISALGKINQGWGAVIGSFVTCMFSGGTTPPPGGGTGQGLVLNSVNRGSGCT